MAVLPMRKISICGLKKERKGILELLQSSGVLELTEPDLEECGLEKTDTLASRQLFERNASTADQALEILQSYIPEKKSMLSSLEGKKLTEAADFKAAGAGSESLLKDANQILSFHKKIAEDKAAIARIQGQIESLTPWLDLDIPVRCPDTRRCTVLVGTLPGSISLEELYRLTAERIPEIEALDLHVVGTDKDQTCIAAVCLKEDGEAVEEALRSFGFSRPAQALDQVPSRLKQDLEREIERLSDDIQAVENKLHSCANRRTSLQVLSDYFRIRAQKYAVLGDLWQSEKAFFITGYVPEKDAAKLEEKLNARFTVSIETEAPSEEDDPPVLLKNGTFASSAEGVTASFGLPAKGEMDPTGVMSICYVFLFGLMLSDAAYGVIVFAACLWALKKYPRMDQGMAKTLRLFMYCGLSTLFWGIMFSGYFGDAVDVISRTFFGTQVSIPALWFIPLNNPMKLLMYSMLFGAIHLYLGLGLKGYMLIRDKKYLDFFCDVILWYAFLTGLVLILLPTELFGSIAQTTIVFPAAVNTLAKVLAIAGAAGILLMSGRSSKNPVLRIALGAYDLYNITGWVSDVLSYSRLLALGLATGVIASVVNQMGSMAGGGVLGAIVFILVFIAGHTFNLGINLLGAYVHTCRLQYVEFFGKFYEGGGKAFHPFKENTKYIEIKED